MRRSASVTATPARRTASPGSEANCCRALDKIVQALGRSDRLVEQSISLCTVLSIEQTFTERLSEHAELLNLKERAAGRARPPPPKNPRHSRPQIAHRNIPHYNLTIGQPHGYFVDAGWNRGEMNSGRSGVTAICTPSALVNTSAPVCRSLLPRAPGPGR